MRLFVAIELSEEVRDGMLRVRDELKSRLAGEGKGISWVTAENLHVTVKFFGEVPETRVKQVCDALGSVGRVGEVELAGSGVLCLPPRGPVRVIAARMDGNLDRLAALHRQIEEKCSEVGFPPDGRRYVPHVTFARVKGRLRVRGTEIERWGEGVFPTPRMMVREFVLTESRLKPQGAEYVRVAGFRTEV